MTDPVLFGILGAAGIARMAVVPAIRNSRNARVAVVGTRNPSAASKWIHTDRGENICDSYEAVLADPEVEAVYIPLPNSEHARWAIAACKAGKAVLCEKPLALTADEAESVVRAGEDAGVKMMEGFMYRFHPQHRRVREIIASGAIGDVVEVQVHLSVDLMTPVDPSNVRFDPKLGGGALLDMGCYGVHIARSVFGLEPQSVLAHWSLDETLGVDVAAAGLLEFPGGRIATVSCSFQGNGQGYFRVIGRRGLIDVPRGIIPGLGDRIAEAIVIRVDENGGRSEETLEAVDQYRLMIEAFADAIRSGDSSLVQPGDSILNMRVLDAFAESARSGRRVKVKM